MALHLTRTAAAAVRRGHPWVYAGGIARAPKGLSTGAPVELAGDDGLVGRGLWDAASPIAVRVFDTGRGPALDTAALAARIAGAIARRDGRFGDDTTAYRL